MINWIASATELLVAVSNAPSCNEQTKDELQKHAAWLAAVLSWVPDEVKSLELVDRFNLADVIFELPLTAEVAAAPSWMMLGRRCLIGDSKPPSVREGGMRSSTHYLARFPTRSYLAMTRTGVEPSRAVVIAGTETVVERKQVLSSASVGHRKCLGLWRRDM